jgi:signal transduction histidine kinase
MLVIKKHKLKVATTVYWFLLVYIIVALLWWLVALQGQNHQNFIESKSALDIESESYVQQIKQIETLYERKRVQYIGEGMIFLLVILIGAVFVYRSVKRELNFGQQQQDLMAAITHELKTPIAAMQLNLQTMQKRVLEPEKHQQMILGTLKECDRLHSLTHNILITSQIESGSYKLSKQEVDFTLVVTNLVHDFQKRFPNRSFLLYAPEKLKLMGEVSTLQLVVSNLMENAVKYSQPDKEVKIELLSDSNYIYLKVIDRGVGLPLSERKHVFEKFYRSNPQNNMSAQGTGLGLYLVKKIVENLGGKIDVYDNKPMGLIFQVKLQKVLNMH